MTTSQGTQQRKASSGVQDIFKELEGPAHFYLSEGDKGELVDSKEPFFITALLRTRTRYGERWECDLRFVGTPNISDYGDGIPTLTLPTHGRRDRIMMKMLNVVQSEPVGPLILTRTDLPDDRTWWDFKPARTSEES